MAAVHRGLEMVEEDAGLWILELTSQVETMATTIAWTGAVIFLLFKLPDSVHHVNDRGNDCGGRLLGLACGTFCCTRASDILVCISSITMALAMLLI